LMRVLPMGDERLIHVDTSDGRRMLACKANSDGNGGEEGEEPDYASDSISLDECPPPSASLRMLASSPCCADSIGDNSIRTAAESIAPSAVATSCELQPSLFEVEAREQEQEQEQDGNDDGQRAEHGQEIEVVQRRVEALSRGREMVLGFALMMPVRRWVWAPRASRSSRSLRKKSTVALIVLVLVGFGAVTLGWILAYQTYVSVLF
ncbi:hypothetical protein LPJ66_001825, partial [Kickxella alabastrina]